MQLLCRLKPYRFALQKVHLVIYELILPSHKMDDDQKIYYVYMLKFPFLILTFPFIIMDEKII